MADRDTLPPAPGHEPSSTLGRSTALGRGALELVEAAAAGDSDEVIRVAIGLGLALGELLDDFDVDLPLELLRGRDR